MTVVDVELSAKQGEAFLLLREERPIDLVYGGGARGGKTWLGCFSTVSFCKEFPGSAWLIGREELKALKRTTLITMFKVLAFYGFKQGVDYKMNMQDMIMTIFNDHGPDSLIFFAELKETPSDPEFDRLGSYDLTGYWIDEAQEVSKNAKDTLKGRLTLLSGEGWETYPKALYTCNPGKNWIYTEFYKPIIKEEQEVYGKHFIRALYTDNPNIDHEKYRRNLLSTDNKVKIQRLLYGDFDYDDTPGRLIDYDALIDCFGRKVESGPMYIIVDPARHGEDPAVAAVFEGFNVLKWLYLPVCNVTGESTEGMPSLEEEVRELAAEHEVPVSRILVDGVGLGSGLVDSLGCRSYMGSRRPVHPLKAKRDQEKKEAYATLNDQCGVLLAKKINAREVGIVSTRHDQEIQEEVDLIIDSDPSSDKPTKLISKDDIKAMIGRSPNFKDVLQMRMYFELEGVKKEREGDSIVNIMDKLMVASGTYKKARKSF